MDRALRGLNQVYAEYRYNCYRRNHYFDLKIEDFKAIIKSDCAYCGAKPRQVRFGLLFNGIDRKNNSRGYTKANCVPCCLRCNSIKGSYLSFAEMVVAMRALKEFWRRKPRGRPRQKNR